ncbi:RHS repeat protein [Pseudomonas sp. DY-1]|nr:RHS repeat protein [Pseudomonas sp. DY-1]
MNLHSKTSTPTSPFIVVPDALPNVFRCQYTWTQFGYHYQRDNKIYSVPKTSCENGVINTKTGICDPSNPDKQKGSPPPSECASPTGFRGNPINSAVGNKFQTEADYTDPQNSELSFGRFYNSIDGLWRHSYSTRIRIATNLITFVQNDGRETHFTLESGNARAIPPELGTLINSNGNWDYTSATEEHLTFNGQGRLTRKISPNGLTQNLTYNNNIITITSSSNKTFTIKEGGLGQPIEFSTGSTKFIYSYNPYFHLSKTTRTISGTSLSEQRIYHYEDPRDSKLLTGITDERGTRYATWAYDDQGRAISSEHTGGADKVLISYNTDGSSTVTNALGQKTTYRFQVIQGVKRIVAIEGEPSPNCPNSNSTFTYDARGLLKTKTDNRGLLTTYEYDARGLEISRTEAVGTPQARTITTDWHPTLFLPVTVTEPNRITTYEYDAQGRRTGQTITER